LALTLTAEPYCPTGDADKSPVPQHSGQPSAWWP